MTIAVTGATGQLGQIIVEKLKAKVPATDIVALVRSPEKAAALGVAVRAADYSKPDTLLAALQGVETLMLVSSNEIGQRAAQHRNAIAAARAAGVKRIVYTSLLHADVSPLSLADEHRDTEAALKESGLDWTILRNGWYAENYTGSIGGALAGGAFYGSAGEGRVSAAPRGDFAEAAVAVLTGAGHENKSYELAGDTAWSLADLAAEISKQTGKDIPYRNIAQADYAAALKGFGLPDGFADSLAAWDVDMSNGALFDDARVLSGLIGRPTTALSTSVAAALNG